MWSLPKPPSGELGISFPVCTEEVEKQQQHIQTFVSDPSIEEFPESTNPFRLRNNMPPVFLPPADKDVNRTKMVAKPTNEPTLSSPRRFDASCSRSHWVSVNAIDSRSPKFATRLDSSVSPITLDLATRLDASVSPITLDLDVSMGSAGRNDHHDDNMSVGSPSVSTAVTGNVSQVTPEDNLAVEDGRERRSRTNSSERARQGRRRGKTARRRTSISRGHVMCGTVELKLNNEIRASMQDINDAVQQIFATVQRFGPDERDAVRNTIVDAGYFFTKKCGATFSPKRATCGIVDVDSFHFSDGSRSPVRDTRLNGLNGNTRMRRVRDGDTTRPTSRRGYESSSCDDSDDNDDSDDSNNSRSTSHDVRRRERAQAKVYSDAVEEVVYSMPIDSFALSPRLV
ncbi:hypothetical protein ACHAW5_007866 [Stephanodiscus triporus]|uniref:Uncharacterized protein n=1 Tax=Stephanodiscus triporus TaxID=2934178 RepID=A0ABD3PCD9_9STRA